MVQGTSLSTLNPLLTCNPRLPYQYKDSKQVSFVEDWAEGGNVLVGSQSEGNEETLDPKPAVGETGKALQVGKRSTGSAFALNSTPYLSWGLI